MDNEQFQILGDAIMRDLQWTEIVGEGTDGGGDEEGRPPAALVPVKPAPPAPVLKSPGAGLVEIMKKHYGPLPGWGWGALAAGIFIGAAWIFPSRRY